jgi:mannosylglycoprotein endo-beta-mannosidase
MAGNRDFLWFWQSARGHFGGLIVGVKSEMFEVEEYRKEDYFLGVLLRQRVTNFRFWFVNIYGPAQHDFSEAFIQELSIFCANEALPVLLGGDFNLIRSNNDRNQGMGDQKLMELFNGFIGDFHLREIHSSGPRFTWSNKQRNPTLIKLDRYLMSEGWENQFPTCVWMVQG